MISGDQLLRPFRIYRGILPMLKKNPNASMVVSLANKPYSITQPASLKIIKSQNWQLILKQPQGPTAWPNPGREFPVVFFSGPVSVSKESQAVTSRDIPKGPHLLTPVNSKKPRSKKKTCWDPMVAISTCPKNSPSQVPCKRKPAAHGFQQNKNPRENEKNCQCWSWNIRRKPLWMRIEKRWSGVAMNECGTQKKICF